MGEEGKGEEEKKRRKKGRPLFSQLPASYIEHLECVSSGSDRHHQTPRGTGRRKEGERGKRGGGRVSIL